MLNGKYLHFYVPNLLYTSLTKCMSDNKAAFFCLYMAGISKFSRPLFHVLSKTTFCFMFF